jgi:hypothetical protein
MERIIVRRGRFLTYELLRRTFGGDPNVEIIWDRRRAADPVEDGGPTTDRRGRPPEQWFRLDYMFTSGAQALSQSQPLRYARANGDEPPAK